MRAKLKEIIHSCLKDFYKKDFDLICHDVSERAISHKLAEYLQVRFPKYNVDCEYNRNCENGKDKPKYLKIIWDEALRKSKGIIEKGDLDSLIEVSTYPDIIVHRRLKNDENLIVIEVKKDNTRVSEDFDLKKLRAFTSKNDENVYKYEFGVFIKLPIRNHKCDFLNETKIRWFQDGDEIKP